MKPYRHLIFIDDYDFSQEGIEIACTDHDPEATIVKTTRGAVTVAFFMGRLVNISFPNFRALSNKTIKNKTFILLFTVLDTFFVDYLLLILFAIIVRPKRIILNTYVLPILISPIAFLLRAKTFYVCADWFAKQRDVSSFWKEPFSSKLFLICDYLCCRLTNCVFNYSDAIKIARLKYWRCSIGAIQSKWLLSPSKRQSDVEINKNAICYIGRVYAGCGLDQCIRALGQLTDEIGNVRIDVIGQRNNHVIQLEKLASEYNVADRIKFHGYLDRKEFDALVWSSFCGVCLITDNATHTRHTVPGKVFEYIRRGTPVLASNAVGEIAHEIEASQLGRVVQPNTMEIISALVELHKNQTSYKKKIENFMAKLEAKRRQFFPLPTTKKV